MHRTHTLRVRPIQRDGQVLVTFALDGGLTDEMKAVVSSGLRTVFTYTVELKLKVPAWVDRTVATAVVSTTVDYDNLTRRHTVSQARNGRVEQSFVVEDPAEVAQMVTNFERLPLFDTKQLEAESRVLRARARRCPSAQQRGAVAMVRHRKRLRTLHVHPQQLASRSQANVRSPVELGTDPHFHHRPQSRSPAALTLTQKVRRRIVLCISDSAKQH